MASNPETRRALPLIFWTVGLTVIAVVAVLVIRSATREQVGVRTAVVTYQDLTYPVSTTGKVEPIDEYQAHAPFPGVVEKLYVQVGQKVTPGTLLVEMNDADARARVATATAFLSGSELTLADIEHGGNQDERNSYAADLAHARMQESQDAASLEQLKRLQQQGAASAAEVSAAQQRLDLDRQNIDTIQLHSTRRYSAQDLARAKAQVGDATAGLAAAQTALANADIRSPIAGTAYNVPVSQYDYVNGGEDLVDVADLTRIRIRAYFDEPEIGHLAPGQPVKIVWEAKPDRVWHGHVEQAPTTVISYGTRSVGECVITVDDAKGDLPPNSNVTVTVTTQQRNHVLSIPREALHTDGTQHFVYRIVDGRLVQTPVVTDLVNLSRAQIVSGLHEGERIATSAVTNRDLTNGLAVTPVK